MDATTLVTPPYVAGPFRLEPFRGLMLAPGRVGNPTTGRAFARPYREVSNRLARWQAKGYLTHDETPALYLHEYTSGGITVRGLVGALDVSRRALHPADRAVLPHEGIHPVQADELADRMAEMRLNPAPILLVHRGSEALRAQLGAVAATEPTHAFTDRSEQQHRIWATRDRETLDLIAAELSSTRALIADGHHRYAAYLRLQRRHAAQGSPVPTDFGLAMLVDQDDTPLFLGPIHRTLVGATMDDLRDAVQSLGLTYEPQDQAGSVAALSATRLAATDGTDWAIIGLDPDSGEAAVETLHRHVVPALPHGPTTLVYHHSVEDALAKARPDAVAVLMPAPSVDHVIRIAEADRLLPEKATSFQPKPSLGVLIRSLRD
ncbi:DUF1015 family protein [Nocardioides sp. zg-536]|uniref:DUF1015 family protein n=1 Tax=Nocardioides faecalis TaxID=2803858 RepID=A0A939BZZ9_9ACTN|nr:DUF1015 family protein [Nocardioides faecalis]MBM9461605.1 DUF1015 family protein [Nocardioides faecalis]MBS4753721.1 DUF1015 family protein [Nocardioides faecalis]QVI57428.1 DUF1015 family protein [Nocardioides faecalis]